MIKFKIIITNIIAQLNEAYWCKSYHIYWLWYRNSWKVSKFEVGHHAGVSKYKNPFAEIYALNLLEEVFANKNL